MTEKTILCYGDSNTWGYIPQEGGRYDKDTRWPRCLAGLLGEGYYVTEQGLNGRTTAFDDPIEPYRNGRKTLEVSLLMHSPIDLFIVMLGTNDTKHFLNLTSYMIGKGLESIVEEAGRAQYGRDGQPPKILVVSPIQISAEGLNDQMREYFDEASEKKAQGLSEIYRQVAQQYGCAFLNAAQYAKPSMRDGIHMEVEDQRALAAAAAKMVRQILD